MPKKRVELRAVWRVASTCHTSVRHNLRIALQTVVTYQRSKVIDRKRDPVETRQYGKPIASQHVEKVTPHNLVYFDQFL
mgnify:CR=1 FL=1